MYTEYENEINEEDLFYQPAERTSDIQLPKVANMLLLGIWIVICLIGFAVMLLGKRPVVGTVIIGVPTFLGMVIKPTFALCMLMLVLPTGAGIGIEGFFTLNRGVGISLAVSFVLNLLISRPTLYIRNKAIWVVALYTIWMSFASMTAPHPRWELQRVYTQLQLLALVLIVYWILETNSEKSLIWVLRSYVLGSLGTIVLTFMTGAAMRTMTDLTEEQRYAATLGREIDANMLAALVSMAFFASMYLFARDRNIFWRVIYLIGIAFFPLMLLMIGSRGALVALAFTMMSPLLFIRQVFRRPALAALLLVVIIIASASMAFLIKTGGLRESVAERMTNIEYARKAISYRTALVKASIGVGFTRPTGSGGRGWFEVSGTTHYPHADFFRALGFYGVPGAAIFALFAIMLMLTVKRIPLGLEKLYARAVLTFLLVMGLDIGQLEQKHFWVFLTIVVVMERIGRLHKSKLEIDERVEWANEQSPYDVNAGVDW